MTHVPAEKVHQVIGGNMLADGKNMVVDTEKSHGSYLYDALSKREYLDFFSFFASMPMGFNHPEMKNDEFIREIGTIALHKVSNSDFYTRTMAEFIQTVRDIATPSYMKKMFFVSGGGLAVENAMKAAFDWKVRKNIEKGVAPKKGMKMIHFKEAFHGRTGYTLSLTNTADPRKYMYFPLFDWPRIHNPKVTFPCTGKNLASVKEAEQIAIDQITDACENNPDDIAGLIIEPIQGEGGDNHFRPEFFRALRERAERYEFLLIYDEVQTGMGVTGKMWAHEHYGVKPDIFSFGKKMQICGIMAGERVLSVKDNVFEESSRINSTWGGNLVDMKRAQRYLEIIRDEKLVQNAAERGEQLHNGLVSIAGETGMLNNVRGEGLFRAFDLETENKRNQFLDTCEREFSLIIPPCGEKTVRFRPYLDVTADDISAGLERIDKAIRRL